MIATGTGSKLIYAFEEGTAQMRDLLGGKGANLAEMTNAGLPVPPGFTITTHACMAYNRNGQAFPSGLAENILDHVRSIEEKTGRRFGDPENPLLVSVRSGAKISMPGMMDTILNLGLNDHTVEGVKNQTQNPRFAYDCYRRFIQMFADVVLGIDKKLFEEKLDEIKRKQRVKNDHELLVENLLEIIRHYKKIVRDHTGEAFPEGVDAQLFRAVRAVFDSWENPRAITYRQEKGIPHDLGTAVNVMAMVFGNMGEDSGTGVAFTRDPFTGHKKVSGEFLMNAQGEDVVAGVRTPLPIGQLERVNADIYRELAQVSERLETHYKDVQDMEFTIERGKLYMLQTRSGFPSISADAAVRVLVEFVEEGLIDKKEALRRLEPNHVNQLLHPRLDTRGAKNVLARGIAASPGGASGTIVFDARRAAQMAKEQKKPVILVRPETNPNDIEGMLAASGILTSRGGMTSHAALVARGWGIPCVVGCEALKIDEEKRKLEVGGKVLKEGDPISVNALTGEVLAGLLPLIEPKEISGDLRTLLTWADEIRKLEVWANADTPEDARRARGFGAQGIGLCRTEHMFLAANRVPLVHAMILAAPKAQELKFKVRRLEETLRKAKGREEIAHLKKELAAAQKELKKPWADYTKALARLQRLQKKDFKGILRAMEGLPVTIRLIDPPLHEFLPPFEKLLEEVITLRLKKGESRQLKEKESLLQAVNQLREQNPMLGLRVCRLGIVYPEIYEMQVQAIFEAACELAKEGVQVLPEVMIPGVGHPNEIKVTSERVRQTADAVMARVGVQVPYHVGTMIEVPRACVVAGDLAHHAEFFSFGTNDLTQTTFAYSRDDAEGSFIPVYLREEILSGNPFETLDTQGVGELMKLAVERGRKRRADLKIGICGEHGGDPASIAFCRSLGLSYVSCSPYRVPVARLALAQSEF